MLNGVYLMSDFMDFFQLISNGNTADYAINVSSKDTRESPMRRRFDQQKRFASFVHGKI